MALLASPLASNDVLMTYPVPTTRHVVMLLLAWGAWSCPVAAQTSKDFELAPINYHNQSTTNRISTLQRLIDLGKSKLAWTDRHGYLPAVLTALDIPVSSQVLVFSKTSVQVRQISPRRPRAIYFNDDTYVAWAVSYTHLTLPTTPYV